MAVIDDKVVAMSFESSKFEAGVNGSISALDKLKNALKFHDAGKGIEGVSKAASRMDLSHIGSGVDAIASRFTALNVAALAVFSSIAIKAVQTGAQLVKSFTLAPLQAGFKEYSTNLNSIQTILANTQASGATLDDVNAALLNLNKYSDQTIYNFSQMAKNIGTFTAAGVDLDTSTQAIKGIANLAALSGSNADQASTAMYQLSQAISAGRVGLQDWNSVVNAGMGGTVFQRALATTAENMGTLKEGTLKLVGPMKNVSINGESFRQSMQAGPGKTSWLTSKVLTQTLKQFTGDLSNAELAAQGFTAAQIKAIQQTAQTAKHAATEVKTISQVLDVARETAGSGWAQTWQLIFGDFGEAKKTFTELSGAINGFINANAEARNKVISDWKALGGRTVLIDSIKTAFHNLGLIIEPIREAFREIFPAKTGKDLYNLTLGLQRFAEAMKPSSETVANLKDTFKGLFAALNIGKMIISGIFDVFKKLIGATGAGNGGFLTFTASIGRFLVALNETLKKGDSLANFFDKLGDILSVPIKLISSLAHALVNLFSGFSSGGVTGQLGAMGGSLTFLETIIHGISTAWNNLIDSFKGTGTAKKVVQGLIDIISGLGSVIGNAAANMNFDAILAVVRTGLFGALVLMFKQFLGKGSVINQLSGLGGGIIQNIAGSFDTLRGTMKSMQREVQARTLKEIAIAIALLAVSLLAISLIKPERLESSLVAIGVLFGELIVAMALLDKAVKGAGFIKLPFITAALIAFAIAIGLLTVAVIAMSKLSWSELIKGLVGVGGLLVGVSVAARILSKSSIGLIAAGVGIIAIAVAMKILASAMKDFAQMSWKEIAKGLVSVGVGLAIIVAATMAMPKLGMVAAGVGLIALATGLKILAGAVSKFAAMNWHQIGRGLAAVAGSLGIIAVTMKLMPSASLIATGAGLILVAIALGKIADAVIKMGGMSINEIAKGLATLGGSLALLAVGLAAMTGSFGGAAALAVAASGITLLVPAIILLGRQSWSTILKSLVSLGAALAVIGIAGVAVAPAVPALIGLGAAVVLLGAGMALAGAGLFLFSAGLSALIVSAPIGVGVLIAAFDKFLEAIPKFAKNLALGALSIVDAFAETAPKFVEAMAKIIDGLLDVIIKSAPKIAQVFTVLITTALKILHDNQGKIIQAGFDLLIALLKGISDNIGKVVTIAADIIVKFLTSIANNLDRIIDAGVQILVKLLEGIGDSISDVAKAAVDIVVKFIEAIGTGYARILKAGVDILVNLIAGIGKNITNIVTVGGDAIIEFIRGVGKKTNDIITAGVDVVIDFIKGLGKNALKLANAAGQVIVDFLNGLTAAVNTYAPQIRNASLGLGFAIIDGITAGMLSKAQGLYNTAKGIGEKALSFIGKPWEWGSPAKTMVRLGGDIVNGLVLGLDKNSQNAYNSALAMSNGLISVFTDTLQTNSPSKVMMEIGQYVGQGFAQGLRQSQSDIRDVFQELNEKLTEAAFTLRETISSEEEALTKLRAEKKPDFDAIKKAEEAVVKSRSLLTETTETHTLLVKQLKDEKNELLELSKEYDTLTTRLDEGIEKLKDLKQERKDALEGYQSQFSAKPQISDPMKEEIGDARKNIAEEEAKLKELRKISAETREPGSLQEQILAVKAANEALKELVKGKVLNAQGTQVDILKTYLADLQGQQSAAKAFSATLQQLRKLGLDDATYKKLLEEGTADQSFAKQLLAGGKTAVKSLNTLDADLERVSRTLATNAADNLYKAGIDSAQGYVNGLRDKKSAIRQEIEEIADMIVQTLRNKLKSKSPSQVFVEIGRDSMEGMAIGLSNSSKLVTNAVTGVANDAMNAMRRSMTNIGNIVSSELNTNPTITPILDLSQVQSGSSRLSELLNVRPLTATTSTGQAFAISSAQKFAPEDLMKDVSGGSIFTFEQNNFSPAALSSIEIYRQTRNQLSQLKSVLA